MILPRIIQLKNGARICMIPAQKCGIAYVSVLVRCGQLYGADPHESEFAHIVEHFQSKYTSTSYPDAIKNNIRIESMGASKNATTYSDFTDYYLTVVSDYLEDCLKLILPSFSHFVLDKKVFTAEKHSVTEELHTRLGNWMWRDLWEKQDAILYKDHPAASHTMKNRLASTSDCTVKQLLAFRDKHYTPENTMIVIAGDHDKSRVLRLIKKYWEKWASSGSHPIRPLPLYDRGPLMCFARKRTATSTRLRLVWMIGDRIVASDPKRVCSTRLLDKILSDGFDSRLLHRLRTVLKIVYFVHSTTDINDYHDSGLVIETESSLKNIPKILRVILDEVSRITTHLCAHKELERARRSSLLEYHRMLLNGDPHVLGDYYGRMIFYRHPVTTIQEELDLIQSIDSRYLRETARLIFRPENLLVMYSGSDALKEEALLDHLQKK